MEGGSSLTRSDSSLRTKSGVGPLEEIAVPSMGFFEKWRGASTLQTRYYLLNHFFTYLKIK
jgi:hypothetical protein